MDFSGSCLCGAVRVSGQAEPAFQVKCHCTDCRKAGAPGLIGVTEGSLSFVGEIREYTSTADSGRWVRRGFCPTCGSGVCSRNEVARGVVFVCATLLDHPNQFQPQMTVFTDSAASWEAITPGIPSFRRLPEPGSGAPEAAS
jgi:hypothetical protein